MSSPMDDPPLDTRQVELYIHDRVNEIRVERDLDILTFDYKLATIARNHSRDMADRRYIAHVNPEGEDPTDRYVDAGYDCRVPVDDRYVTGAENVGKTFFQAPLETGERHDDEDDVATGVVGGWMESPEHRTNILRPVWRCEGIGVAVAEEQNQVAVYATQNFC